MAKGASRATQGADASEASIDERDRPTGAMIGLVVGFLVLVAVAVVTVFVPELRDDAGEEEGASVSAPAPPPTASPPPRAATP